MRTFTAIVEKEEDVLPAIHKFENKLTLRLTYHDPKKQLSSTDIAPIRQKLESLI